MKMISESKIMASTLIVSILLHTGLFCLFIVFAAQKHSYEKVLTVGLVLPSSISGYDLKMGKPIPQVSGRIGGRANHQTIADIRMNNRHPETVSQGNEFPQEKDVASNFVGYNSNVLSLDNSQSISIKQNNPFGFGGTNKDNGEATLISGNSNGGTGRLRDGSSQKSGNGSGMGIGDFGKKVLEGEFGAIQGLSFLKMVKPDYPILARKLGKEGKVLLRLFIDELGKVANVEVIEKAGYGFDEAAIEAMKASTFVPAKIDGKSTPCRALVPVKFTLKKES